MDTIPNGEPSEQLAPDTTAEIASEQQHFGEPASRLEGFSSDQLMAALEAAESGEPPVAVTPAAPAASHAPAAPADGEGQQPGDAPPAEGDGPQTLTKPKGRLSVRALPPEQQTQLAQALDLVRTGEAADIVTALSKVTGRTPAAPVADPTATPAEGNPASPAESTPASNQVAEIQSQIARLREERREAKANFDGDAETTLTEQIEDLQLQLLRAEQAAAVAAVENRSYQETYQAAVEAVESRYPALRDAESTFSQLLDDRVAAMQARGDQDLADPRFIERVADDLAAKLGIQKGAAPPAPPARAARPVGSFAPGHQSDARLSPEAARELIRNVPIEVLQDLVFTE